MVVSATAYCDEVEKKLNSGEMGECTTEEEEEIKNVIKTLREALSSANYASIKESFEQLRTLTEVHLNSTNPAN